MNDGRLKADGENKRIRNCNFSTMITETHARFVAQDFSDTDASAATTPRPEIEGLSVKGDNEEGNSDDSSGMGEREWEEGDEAYLS